MSMDIQQYKALLAREARTLPDQSPLEHFVHHNNLHHFEHMPFEKAVEEVFYTHGRTPYMGLSYFREKVAQGEIEREVFFKKLEENGFWPNQEGLKEFILEMLHSFPDEDEIGFLKGERLMRDKSGSSLLSMKQEDYELWSEINKIGLEAQDIYPDYHANRSLSEVDRALIPFLAALTDQGQASEQLSANQKLNPWEAFQDYMKGALGLDVFSGKSHLIPKEHSAEQILYSHFFKTMDDESLTQLVRRELNSIPGWAGMIHKLSLNREVAPRAEIALDLHGYLLMRMVLADIFKDKPVPALHCLASPLQIKENVFHCILNYASGANAEELASLFSQLSPIVLRRVFQQAYEECYRNKVLSGLQQATPMPRKRSARYQMFFCIDDREESIRRYLEEESELVETFGVAGFFGFDMLYQKAGELRARRLCPPAAVPKTLVREDVDDFLVKNTSLAQFGHFSSWRARTASFILSPIRFLDLKLQLFAPSARRKMGKGLFWEESEKIHYQNKRGQKENGLELGYSLEGLAVRVAGILKGAGLTKNFAPYVFMIGHGHDSFNNPHVAAYRCGACSGANAYPNAKIFAKAANDPKVRELLAKEHGIELPAGTVFVGGYHDTCNDNIELHELENSKMESSEIKRLEEIFLAARQANALERCRKFFQVDTRRLTAAKALKKVENRAWNVAEPRPELNHATNALAIVGRRELTQGAFLDRKAFLISYDPLEDGDGSILAGLLRAVVPVCAGINLEYYFSKVDTENFGSGSKTSHNVTGLLGVMNGVRGDLRTGLVWQMVEYHDPLRITFIIEARKEHLLKVMSENEQVGQLIRNRWVYTVFVDPEDKTKMSLYQPGGFEAIDPLDLPFGSYQDSSLVPTGLESPVHFAQITGGRHD